MDFAFKDCAAIQGNSLIRKHENILRSEKFPDASMSVYPLYQNVTPLHVQCYVNIFVIYDTQVTKSYYLLITIDP